MSCKARLLKLVKKGNHFKMVHNRPNPLFILVRVEGTDQIFGLNLIQQITYLDMSPRFRGLFRLTWQT
jgi:hypothetical protein